MYIPLYLIRLASRITTSSCPRVEVIVSKSSNALLSMYRWYNFSSTWLFNFLWPAYNELELRWQEYVDCGTVLRIGIEVLWTVNWYEKKRSEIMLKKKVTKRTFFIVGRRHRLRTMRKCIIRGFVGFLAVLFISNFNTQ